MCKWVIRFGRNDPGYFVSSPVYLRNEGVVLTLLVDRQDGWFRNNSSWAASCHALQTKVQLANVQLHCFGDFVTLGRKVQMSEINSVGQLPATDCMIFFLFGAGVLDLEPFPLITSLARRIKERLEAKTR